MRSRLDEVTFARPIRWMVALYGGRPLKVRHGEVISGSATYGHRFAAPKSIALKGTPEDYVAKLRRAKVLVDPAERRAALEQELAKAAKAAGGKIRPDEPLVEQVPLPRRAPDRRGGRVREIEPRSAARGGRLRDAEPPALLRAGRREGPPQEPLRRGLGDAGEGPERRAARLRARAAGAARRRAVLLRGGQAPAAARSHRGPRAAHVPGEARQRARAHRPHRSPSRARSRARSAARTSSPTWSRRRGSRRPTSRPAWWASSPSCRA